MESNTLSRQGAITLLLIATLTIMVGSAVVPSLPDLAVRSGFGDQASWLITLPSLGVLLFGPLAGWLIDRRGARDTLFPGLVLYGWLNRPGICLSACTCLPGCVCCCRGVTYRPFRLSLMSTSTMLNRLPAWPCIIGPTLCSPPRCRWWCSFAR